MFMLEDGVNNNSRLFCSKLQGRTDVLGNKLMVNGITQYFKIFGI